MIRDARNRPTCPLPRRRTGALCAFALLLLTALPSALPSAAQPDTTAAAQPEATAPARSRLPEDHSPRGALWRAAAVPGWGQYYNRQYYKIPVVYAGLGGIIATALLLNREYLIFRHAALYADYRDAAKKDRAYRAAYVEAFQRALARVGAAVPPPEEPIKRFAEPLRQRRDIFRRNRDLSYLGIGLFYGLTMLDAYVSAHLLDFDVGEDLTLAVRPAPLVPGVGATLRLGF